MKRNNKRIVFVLLIALLVCAMLPVSALAKGSESHHDGWTAWTETNKLPTTAGSYYLTDDVEVTTWNIPKNTTITLCLNGHSIKGNGSGSVITVSNVGAVLHLWDCDTTTPHYFDGSWTLTNEVTGNCIYGGVITGGNATNGGGISVSKTGSLTMDGVAVVGNVATSGGGIYTRNNTELTDCYIAGNTANNGGGIYEYNTGITLTLNGCTVAANTAKNGGGIYATDNASTNKSTLKVINSIISGNKAEGQGGGIYADNIVDLKNGTQISKNSAKTGGGICAYPGASPKYTSITLGDSVIVSGNTAASGGGGGIHASGNTTLTIAEGSKVTDNSSSGLGGGIVLNNQANCFMSGEISGNKAGTKGGGIYMTAAKLTMNEGKITGNTAPNGGGLFIYQNDPSQISNTVLGGSANITGNANENGGASNVYTDYHTTVFNSVLTIGELNRDFAIGIDVRGAKDSGFGPFTSNAPSDDLSAYFTPDNPNKYVIYVKGNGIDGDVNYKDNHYELVTVGTLIVTKKVDGRYGKETKSFNFSITLSETGINGRYGDVNFKDGVAEFSLKHGQSVTVSGLPVGISYRVKEQDYREDGYYTTSTGETGTISSGEASVAKFVNRKDGTIPATGDNTPLLYLAIVTVLSCTGAILVNRKKRRG